MVFLSVSCISLLQSQYLNTIVYIEMTLRTLRCAADLTQAQLARLAGIEQETVSALERGRVVNPTTATVKGLCRALDKSPADIEAAIRESVKVAA